MSHPEVASAQSSPALSQDPVLRAMTAEMARSKSGLKLGKEQAPYYIEYAISDQDNYEAEAVFGSLRTEQRVRSRLLRVLVRVGDYKQDSVAGQNESVLEFAPRDDDILSLRTKVWPASD